MPQQRKHEADDKGESSSVSGAKAPAHEADREEYSSPDLHRKPATGSSSSSQRRQWQASAQYLSRPGNSRDEFFSPTSYGKGHPPSNMEPPPHAYDQLDLNLNDEIMATDDVFLLGPFTSSSGPSEEAPTSPQGSASSRLRSSQPQQFPYRRSSPYNASSTLPSSTTPSSKQPLYSSYTPGASPPGYSNPRSSPPKSAGSSAGGYYGSYSPYYQHRFAEAESPYSPYDDSEDGIPQPPSSQQKRPRREVDGDVSGTPEKSSRSKSPFQSPISHNKAPRRSPFHPSPSNIGLSNSNSFGGMDTPLGALPPADFSPLTNLYGGWVGEDARLMDYGFNDTDDSPIRPGGPPEVLMGETSPLRYSRFVRSPMPPPQYAHHHASYGCYPQPPRSADPSKVSSGRRPPSPRKLWPKEDMVVKQGSDGSSSAAPGHMRLKFGGAGSTSTRSKLDDINSMMNPPSIAARPVAGYPPSNGPPPAHGYHHPLPHPGAYQGKMTTPIKADHRAPLIRHYAGHIPRPSTAEKPKSQNADYAPKTPYLSSGNNASRKALPSVGKENVSNKKSPASSKKSSCNCKRSKCLKLYCECFAAQRFCNGCNCVDCGNTPTAGQIRDKAIEETKRKNPNAFQIKIEIDQGGHNMGCRCKKSGCLKKYCECFQAGVNCGAKCKCLKCMNYAGSQALIDKRRKIKDFRGADFAMRVADEAWKGKSVIPNSGRKPVLPHPSSSSSRRSPVPSPMAGAGGSRLPPQMLHSTPRGPHVPHHVGSHGPPPHHPHYMGHPHMMMGPPIGYSPMGMPMTPAGYPPHPGKPHHGIYPPQPPPHIPRKNAPLAPKSTVTPLVSTPKTPAVRIQFDPATSRKKRKLSSGESEPTLPYFGDQFPKQPKTTALAIFSFLPNDELYNAGLVCKSWSELAVDKEFWKFQR